VADACAVRCSRSRDIFWAHGRAPQAAALRIRAERLRSGRGSHATTLDRTLLGESDHGNMPPSREKHLASPVCAGLNSYLFASACDDTRHSGGGRRTGRSWVQPGETVVLLQGPDDRKFPRGAVESKRVKRSDGLLLYA